MAVIIGQSLDDHYVICDVCKENLGDYRPFFAQEHLKKYPTHKKYNVLVGS
jgi:hypothetical protein